MIKIKGKYGIAKIFTDDVSEEAIKQIQELMDQKFVEGSQVRFMPDVHKGKGCTIGTTMIVNDKICPNLVGVDISCGMLTINLGNIEIDLKKFDEIVNKYIPAGFNVREIPLYTETELNNNYNINLKEITNIDDNWNLQRFLNSIGTLGGGNHFIELDKDSQNNIYLVIHTGSRYLGKHICEYYQNKAIKMSKDKDSEFRQKQLEIINNLKREGKQVNINKELSKLNEDFTKLSKDLAYIDKNRNEASKEAFNNYINDSKICQRYASLNRLTIGKLIIYYYFNDIYHENGEILLENNNLIYTNKTTNLTFSFFETIHNYIEIPDDEKAPMILRKGAISTKKGELVLIPLNMRDGSLICIGKGNCDWNYSGPHGAGRSMSRFQAKENISLEKYKETMKGIYSSSVNEKTIDEAPMVYKNADTIISNIKESVEIVNHIKPIYNFKAPEQNGYWLKGEFISK